MQTFREAIIHKCAPQDYHYPVAAARDKALDIFDAIDFPSLLMKLPSLDQVSMIKTTESKQNLAPLPKLKPVKSSTHHIFAIT